MTSQKGGSTSLPGTNPPAGAPISDSNPPPPITNAPVETIKEGIEGVVTKTLVEGVVKATPSMSGSQRSYTVTTSTEEDSMGVTLKQQQTQPDVVPSMSHKDLSESSGRDIDMVRHQTCSSGGDKGGAIGTLTDSLNTVHISTPQHQPTAANTTTHSNSVSTSSHHQHSPSSVSTSSSS